MRQGCGRSPLRVMLSLVLPYVELPPLSTSRSGSPIHPFSVFAAAGRLPSGRC